MTFVIFKKLFDEAGNVLFFEDGTFVGDESQVMAHLYQLNSKEGYEHIAEHKTDFGSRVYALDQEGQQ